MRTSRRFGREEENAIADDVVNQADVGEGHGDHTAAVETDEEGLSKRCADAPPSPPRKRSRSSSQASSGKDEVSRNIAETEGWMDSAAVTP
eukprot:g10092.t1